MQDAVIVTGLRTAQGRAHRGALKDARPDDLAAHVVKKVIEATPGLEADEVEDVVLGCAMPEAEQGMNVARVAAIRAGLPTSVPGFTVNRFCSSGLQAVAIAAERVMLGAGDVMIAGGVESMSRVPMFGYRPAPNPVLVREYPQLYMGMGYTAEELVGRCEVSREDQDAFALRSHERAAAAQDAGRFDDEIVAIELERKTVDESSGEVRREHVRFDRDECIRRETSYERLASLKPVFKSTGSITAGNSSQMSDGAAATVVMSARRASELGLAPKAIYRSFAVAGVDPVVMGLGPVRAVPKALAQAGIQKDDLDLVELNEAFAGQALAVIRQLDLNPEIVNVNGGAVALGHPLGCTGARQTVTIAHEAARRGAKYGLVTMCIGGGMGAAGVFEFV